MATDGDKYYENPDGSTYMCSEEVVIFELKDTELLLIKGCLLNDLIRDTMDNRKTYYKLMESLIDSKSPYYEHDYLDDGSLGNDDFLYTTLDLNMSEFNLMMNLLHTAIELCNKSVDNNAFICKNNANVLTAIREKIILVNQ